MPKSNIHPQIVHRSSTYADAAQAFASVVLCEYPLERVINRRKTDGKTMIHPTQYLTEVPEVARMFRAAAADAERD